MSTEKARYRNRGPSSPLDMKQLKFHLNCFSHERLVETLWLNTQYNSILWKALISSIAIQEARGDWEKIKQAIDFAFYFSDYIPYSEHGHGIIIDQLIHALDFLYQDIGDKFALQVAHYVYEEGQKVLECFDEGWDWVCALESLKSWIDNNNKDNN